MMLGTVKAPAFVTAVIVASLPAQVDDDQRGNAIGEVRAANGDAWVGAEVVLVSRPVPANPNVGDEDRVRTTTDARGRFRARVLRGRPYSVWAQGDAGAGRLRMTQVEDNGFVQRPLLLRERGVAAPRRVRLTNTASWHERRPLRARLVVATGNRQVIWLDVDADDGLALPPLVAGASLELFGTGAAGPLPIGAEQLPASGDEPLEFALPDRVTKAVICHSDARRPLASVVVLQPLGDRLYSVGTTDADGKLVFDAGPHASTFLLASGHVMGFQSDGVREDAGVVTTALQRGSEVHARIVGVDDEPVVDAELTYRGLASSRTAHSRGHCSFEYSVRTDGEGRVTLPGLYGTPSTVTANLVLGESQYARLPPPWRSGLLPVGYVSLPTSGTAANPTIVDLRRLCPVEFEVRTAQGLPAAFAALGFAHLDDDGFNASGHVDLHADQNGRLRVLLPGDAAVGVRVVHEESCLIQALATRGGDPRQVARAILRLPRPSVLRGSVVDRNGKPLARSFVIPIPVSETPATMPGIAASPEQPPAGGNTASPFVPENREQAQRLMGLIVRAVESDADGNFVLPLPPVAMPLAIEVSRFRYPAVLTTDHLQPWHGESISGVVVQER